MRNLLRNRQAVGGAAFAGTLAVITGVSAIAVNAQAEPLPVVAQAASGATESKAGSKVEGKMVGTTPEGLLVALLGALPEGRTSNYAGMGASAKGNEVSQLMAQTYLDDGSGPGLLRLSVDQMTTVPGARPSKPLPGSTSWKQEDGDVISVNRLEDNCIQSLVVTRERPDGVFVQLAVASCLAWDGKENKAAREALTQEQAIAVVDDERLDLKMPQELVTEGAERFPDLPTIE